MILFENSFIRVEKHESTIPWIKIFSVYPYKELSECDKKTRKALLKATAICEKVMIKYYRPTKINIASFGNYLPHVHIHVMARFENDSHYPEPMWGAQQREGELDLPSFDLFAKRVKRKLKHKV